MDCNHLSESMENLRSALIIHNMKKLFSPPLFALHHQTFIHYRLLFLYRHVLEDSVGMGVCVFQLHLLYLQPNYNKSATTLKTSYWRLLGYVRQHSI